MVFAIGDLVELAEHIPSAKLAQGMTGLVLSVLRNPEHERYWFYRLRLDDGRHEDVEGRRLRVPRRSWHEVLLNHPLDDASER